MVIGLDCASPDLVFDRFRSSMPHVARLMERGTWGPLRSCVPPITVPAWASMLSGLDPGQLGLYGLRDRRPGSYQLDLADSARLPRSLVWDRLGAAGKQVAVLFVPPSYPPFEVNGSLVSCFLTPGADCSHTYPVSLADELAERFGPYLPDLEGFRHRDREALPAELHRLAEQHFDIAEHIWQTRRPDCLIMVEIGPDRLHHAFWHHLYPEESANERDRHYEEVCRSYYRLIDQRVGRLADLAGEESSLLLVSDHGARALRGGICINELLITNGWLRLQSYPDRPTPLSELRVDWSGTRAWGEGGYHGRVFINLAGREPQGVVDPADYRSERERLARLLESVAAPDGRRLDNRVVAPEQCYAEVNGLPPDLLVFFDDLGFRSIGSVGHATIHTPRNDRGPDGCNHHWDGIFVMAGGDAPRRGRINGAAIRDVASTILGLMKLPVPHLLAGIDRSR